MVELNGCAICGTHPPTDAGGDPYFDPDKTVDRAALNRMLAASQPAIPEAVPAPPQPEPAPLPQTARQVEAATPPVSAESAPALVQRFCGACGKPASAGAFCGACGQALPLIGGSAAASSAFSLPADQPSYPSPRGAAPYQLTPPPRSWPLGERRDSPPTYGGLAGLTIDRSWGARLRRGWQFSLQALDLMRKQPGLVAVPAIASGVILVQLILIAAIGGALPSALAFLWVVAGLVSVYTVGVTSQAVIVVRIGALLNGEQLTNRQALSRVTPRAKDIVTWAAISFTVGVVIRSMERARGPIGWIFRMVAVGIALAWSALTFFVVPVMIFEGLSAADSIKRSRDLVRQVWGEGVVGVGILNVLFNLVALGVVILCVLLAAAHAVILALILFMAMIVAFNLLAAVVSPIFVVVMYRFATAGEVAFGFRPEDLASSMRPRRRAAARAF